MLRIERLHPLLRYSFTALLLAGLYAHFVEYRALTTRQHSINIAGLHPAFDGYRIAHISDIHMGKWMGRERLLQIVERVNALQPDMIAITGDFITRWVDGVGEDLQAGLSALRAPDGIYAVAGNHDYYDIKAVRRVWRDSGLIDLSNSYHSIRRAEGCLHLAGVDDIIWRKARLDLVLKQLPAEGTAILLAHEPDFADISAATGRFALQLSGHTHGGQIALPIVGAIFRPKFGTRYVAGYYQLYGTAMQLYVNRGLGVVRWPLRLTARPEITLLTLRCTDGVS